MVSSSFKFAFVTTLLLASSAASLPFPKPEARLREKRLDFVQPAITLPIVFEILHLRADKVLHDIDTAGSELENDALDQLLGQLSDDVSTSITSLAQLHGLSLHQINNAADGSHVLTEKEDMELLEGVSGPIKTRLEAITAPVDPHSAIAEHAAEIRLKLDTLAEGVSVLLRDAPEAAEPLLDLKRLSAKEGIAVLGLGVAALNVLGYK